MGQLKEKMAGDLKLRGLSENTCVTYLRCAEAFTKHYMKPPPPRSHQLRYWGVLSSHSSLRAEVVPEPPVDDAHQPAPAGGDQLELFGEERSTTRAGPRHRWSYLLRRVFRADVEHCPRCGGPMRWLELATGEAVERLLIEHGLAPRAPPVHAVPLGQLGLPFAG